MGTAAGKGRTIQPERALSRRLPAAKSFGIREAGAMLVNLPWVIRDGDRAWSAYQGG